MRAPSPSRPLPSWLVTGGRVLVGETLEDRSLTIADGAIAAEEGDCDQMIDASGLYVLPGIVDIHGDAFERQMMPRPGVSFDLTTALLDTDRQLVANGITTAFHGITRSWEPGLRGPENARGLLAAIVALRPRLAADTWTHLRHETFALDDLDELVGWIERREIGCLAFNDHTTALLDGGPKPEKMAKMVERSGLSHEAFVARVEHVAAGRDAIPAATERLAAAARAAGVPMLSHDDVSPEMRRRYRALGVTIAEFPLDVETAEEAVASGEATVFGSPNVLRGRSHIGSPTASAMVARGLCSILASDYYYPALAAAPFRLAADGTAPLERAWGLVSSNPAAALGLTDRGRIAAGRRGDVVLVDAGTDGRHPRVVATFAAGRLVHLAEGARLA